MMDLTRRKVLWGATALPLLAGSFGPPSFAQTAPTAPPEMPPVLFVHGNGDHAALWITTLWRMESNGVPRDHMFAINFTDPLARSDDFLLHRRPAPRARRSHRAIETENGPRTRSVGR